MHNGVDIAALARMPLTDDAVVQRVEICMMKHTAPEVEALATSCIIQRTQWPFKLNIYDNRNNPPNTARMWNKFVRDSTCPIVCIVDSDVFVPILEPCWLTRMVQRIPFTDVVLATANRCANPEQRADCAGAGMIDASRDWSSFVMLFRRDLLEKYGPFDEEFLGYGPDSEFAARLRHRGGRAVICRDVWVQHLHGYTHGKRAEREADGAYALELYKRKVAAWS